MRWVGILCLWMGLGSPAVAQDFFTLKGHGGPIMGIAVGPAGDIATASFDNAVGHWDGAEPHWLDGHEAAVNAVAFLQDDVLISGGDDNTVRLWPAPGISRVLGEHTAKVIALDVAPDVGLVASASWDSTIGLWQLGDGDGELLDPDLTAEPPVFLRGHRQGVNDVAFSANGTRIYSASTDGTIRVWDVATAQEVQLLANHGFGVNELIINEAAGWLAYGAVDGGTRFLDIETGELIADFTLERSPILALAFSPTTDLLAVGDGEGHIMMVDTASMRIARDFQAARQGPIWALAFSPDGQNIHAAGIENILYSWPVETIREFEPMSGAPRTFLTDPALMENGERQFQRKCSICHTLRGDTARRAGPTLEGLFGRRAGTVTDYAYSSILTESDIIWSDETINALFDEGPDHYIPGTKMPMQRITGAQDRADLIAFLRDATAGGGD